MPEEAPLQINLEEAIDPIPTALQAEPAEIPNTFCPE
jgi:hypothetical protein